LGARTISLALVMLALAASPATLGYGALDFPAPLDRYLTDDVKLTAEQRRQLLAGGGIAQLLDVTHGSEIRVVGAIWVAAPVRRYLELLNDIERFERGRGFPITKRISAPPRLEDFSQLELPASDVRALRNCRVGDCDVKLGAEAVERFRTEVAWQAADAHAQANAMMRRISLDYVEQYLAHGNERLSVYRDHARPTAVAREFADMVGQMPEVTKHLPDLQKYLLGSPRVTLPGSTSFLYWQITEFGFKPTFRISQVTIHEAVDETVVTSKMLYASHYFWTALELRRLVPDRARGPGFWFVMLNSSRADGLTGFIGMFVKWRARSEVRAGALAALHRMKDRLEQPRSNDLPR
jgi:hypothetical protein